MRLSEIRDTKLRCYIANLLKLGDSEQKRIKQRTLERKTQAPPLLVCAHIPLLVRITRVYVDRSYDDDNLNGGCKELRDAIASALGRRGDGTENGLQFEYLQRPGERPQAIIEVFKYDCT